jgi:multicomponent Na+:H+ antiporter subunit E
MMRIIAFIEFLLFYLKEILVSNIRVAYDVLTPEHKMKPGIIALDVMDMTDAQISMMANFITMTPGTLGLAVSENHQKLYIHVMYLDTAPEKVAAQLLNDYGKRVKRVI